MTPPFQKLQLDHISLILELPNNCFLSFFLSLHQVSPIAYLWGNTKIGEGASWLWSSFVETTRYSIFNSIRWNSLTFAATLIYSYDDLDIFVKTNLPLRSPNTFTPPPPPSPSSTDDILKLWLSVRVGNLTTKGEENRSFDSVAYYICTWIMRPSILSQVSKDDV